MAKFIKEYENGTIKNILIFRNETYTLTISPYVDGQRKSIEDSFSIQLRKSFPNDEGVRHIIDYLDIDNIDCCDNEEIEDILQELEDFE